MCSMPHCSSDSALEFHHIDGDSSNNDSENLLVLCSNHHAACTKGRIDAHSCRQIKKTFVKREIQLRSSEISKSNFRAILRDELQRSKESRTSRKSSPFPTALDRRYLFRVLKYPIRDLFEVYMAIRVVGALKPRGATQQLISTQKLLEKKVKRAEPRTYSKCYLATIQSMGNIGTREGLQWLAGELIRQKRDKFYQFVIYMAIGASPNSRRHIGFKLTDKKHLKPGETMASFRHQGKRYRLLFRFEYV